LNSARQLGAEFRYEEAIQHLRPVVRHEPQLLEARRLLASFSYLSGDFETARSLYEGLLEADPANVRYRMQSVPVLVGLGEGEKALAVIDELERDAPNEEGLFALKGESLEALGRREDAIAAFRKDGELRPGRAAPRWHIAKILQTEGRTEEARRELERGLAEEPGHAATLSALADAAYAEGNEALGDTLVARALASDRLEPNANLLRGWRAHQAGDLQAAREAYEVAVRVKPRFAKARYNLGTVWLALRRPEEAREQFAAALESGQETADVRLNLGVALAQLQRIEDAMDEWERALELNPDPATANRLQQNIALARRALGQKTP
jgi:tetratricopeptide (TPR) repeat protein